MNYQGKALTYLLMVCLILSSAETMAKVIVGEEHYPGFINLEGDYSIFYWLFKARNKDADAPFIIWIQGGPGCSGTGSVLEETGPYELTEDGNIVQRQYSLNNFADVLFIDQPIGTGFSNNTNFERIPNTEDGVVKDFLNFINKFFIKFPQYKSRGLYLVGQSYAGHYVPALAKGFLEAGIKVNGAAINNGWYNPEIQVPNRRGDYIYLQNRITPLERLMGWIAEGVAVFFIKLGWANVGDYWTVLADNIYRGFEHKKFNANDIRLPCPDEFVDNECYDDTILNAFISRNDFRSEIGVGNRSFIDCNYDIDAWFVKDVYTDITPLVIELLNKYELKMIIFAGDQDYVCDMEGQKEWIKQLNWKHRDQLNAEPWKEWIINGYPFGKYQKYKHLTHAIVYDSGHVVASDQPPAMLDAVYRLIYSMD